MKIHLTYIGGKYTPAKFIKEANKFGITRRLPANIAKSMNFGDTVLCLQWRGKGIPPAVFAAFIINGIVFDGDIQKKVVEKLKAEGKIVQDNSGAAPVHVQRECGDFLMGGGAYVREDVSIGEIVEIAQAAEGEDQDAAGIAKADKGSLWCMVSGTLSKTYLPPRTLNPAPNFTRGFMALPEGMTFAEENADRVDVAEDAAKARVVGVTNYEKAWD
jgi:hypothetical protein